MELIGNDKSTKSDLYDHFYDNICQSSLEIFFPVPNTRLHTNFQLKIFIFEARVNFQTLLQKPYKKKKKKKSLSGKNVF